MKQNRFHGAHEESTRQCEAPACEEAGQFRAPGVRPAGFDGPGEWRWFCLEHVRQFNAGYDWFEGMSADEVAAAQAPAAGWANETKVFRADAGMDGMPRWADFEDPMDAIGIRANEIKAMAAGNSAHTRWTPREREALNEMGLKSDVDRQALRRRYSELVRRFHPDRNGGDRSYEARLGRVVEAYKVLRKAVALD